MKNKTIGAAVHSPALTTLSLPRNFSRRSVDLVGTMPPRVLWRWRRRALQMLTNTTIKEKTIGANIEINMRL